MLNFELMKIKKVSGDLQWGSKASNGTKTRRDNSIRIIGNYELKWEKYSEPPMIEPYKKSYSTFKYLLVKIELNPKESADR